MEYRQNIHNIPKAELKKRLRANDSLNKYKKKNQNIMKKPNFDSNEYNDDLPVQRLRTQLTEASLHGKERENPLEKYEYREQAKKPSYIGPKYQLNQARTPKRDFRRKHNLYFNTLSNRLNSTTYLKTTENINNNNYETDTERRNNIREMIRDKIRNRYYSRPNLHRANNNYNIDDIERRNELLYERSLNRTKYINDNIKMKETITLKNILKKQNDELVLKAKKMEKIINELITKQKKLSNENQYIKNENKNILMNLNGLQSEIDSKNNEINELNNEINQLRFELNEKNNMIMNLQNMNNNEINNNNNNNEDINELEFNHENEIKN